MMVAERILYRASEVAGLIGASRAEVYLLIRRGILPSVKVGAMVRVPAAALKAMVEQQRTKLARESQSDE